MINICKDSDEDEGYLNETIPQQDIDNWLLNNEDSNQLKVNKQQSLLTPNSSYLMNYNSKGKNSQQETSQLIGSEGSSSLVRRDLSGNL
jgi:hypothetical protein